MRARPFDRAAPGIVIEVYRIERDPEIMMLLARQARIERAAARALAWNNRLITAATAAVTALMAWNCLPTLLHWII